jgi:rubrerythrin
MNDPRKVAEYIQCLSLLEDETSQLYSKLSQRIKTPLIKSLLLSISKDSSKHSTLLKGVAKTISASKQNPKDCAKKLGKVWSAVSNYIDEIDKEEIGEMNVFLQKLSVLESTFGEEYYLFVQMKTLQLMAKMINQLYSINVENIKKVFVSIIKDEERHREILVTIKNVIEENLKEHNNIPKVKYQNPDVWVRSLPPSTYDSR